MGVGGGGSRGGQGGTLPGRAPHPSPPQIGVWYSNRTLAMNATTLDINLSQTLANKTLVVTTILVSGPCGEAVGEGAFPEQCPAWSSSGGGMHTDQWGHDSCAQQPLTRTQALPSRAGSTGSALRVVQPGPASPLSHSGAGNTWPVGLHRERTTSVHRQGACTCLAPGRPCKSLSLEWSFCHTCQPSVWTYVNLLNIHLEDVETEAQRGEATCPGSHSW